MNIEEKINELQKQIESHNQLVNQQMLELQQLLLQQNNKVEETVKEKSVHKLVIGERKLNEDYYMVDSYKDEVVKFSENFDRVDNKLYENFNYFQNKDEAKRYLRLAYLNNKMIRIRNYLNNGWYLINDDYHSISLYTDDKEDYVVSCLSDNISPLFFKTQELTEEFLKLVDRKELIEYLQLMEGYMPNA